MSGKLTQQMGACIELAASSNSQTEILVKDETLDFIQSRCRGLKCQSFFCSRSTLRQALISDVIFCHCPWLRRCFHGQKEVQRLPDAGMRFYLSIPIKEEVYLLNAVARPLLAGAVILYPCSMSGGTMVGTGMFEGVGFCQ